MLLRDDYWYSYAYTGAPFISTSINFQTISTAATPTTIANL